MATEHFCLRWNNHQSTLVSVFDNLLESGTLVDCTLAADGRYLKAHKVVLSACSTYLGMLLSQHHDKHPIIILKDVKFDELKAMLDYMYRGEVNISQEQLSTFLKAAESLQIKGLTDTGSEEGNGLFPTRPPSSSSTTSLTNDDPQSPIEGSSSPVPKKRKRNKNSDDPPDIEAKVSLSDEVDRASLESGLTRTSTNTGSPSAVKNVSFGTGSVKREPTDGEGDGQISVDDSGDSAMMARPGPSNCSSTNNKGSPWILSADSTGEEMQLTPGQGHEDKGRHSKTLQEESVKDAVIVEKHYFSEEFVNANQSKLNSPADDIGLNQDIVSHHFSPNEKFDVKIYNTSPKEGELIVPDLIETSGNYNPSQRNTQYFNKDQSKMVAGTSEDHQHSYASNNYQNKLYDHSHTFSKESIVFSSSGDGCMLPTILDCCKKDKKNGPKDSLKVQENFTKPKVPISSNIKNINSKETPQTYLLPNTSSSDTKTLTSKETFQSVSPTSNTSSKSLDVNNVNSEKQLLINTMTSELKSKFRKILPAPEKISDTLPSLKKQQLSKISISQLSQKYNNSGMEREKDPLDCNIKPSTSLLNKPHSNSFRKTLLNMNMQLQPHYTNSPSRSYTSVGCITHQITSNHQPNKNILVQGNHLMIQPSLSGPNPQTSNITTLVQPQFSIINQSVNNQNMSNNEIQAFAQPQYQRVVQSAESQNIVINQQPLTISSSVFPVSSSITCTRESTTGLVPPSMSAQTSFIQHSSSFPPSKLMNVKSPKGQLNSTMIPHQTSPPRTLNVYKKMQVFYMRPSVSGDPYLQNGRAYQN